jgi:hypothetical protein
MDLAPAGAVRASLAPYSTDEDDDRLLNALAAHATTHMTRHITATRSGYGAHP